MSDGETILQTLHEMYSAEGKLMEIPDKEQIREAFVYVDMKVKQQYLTVPEIEILTKIIHALEKLTNDLIKITEKCEDVLYGGFI